MKGIVDAQQYLFETLWSKAIPIEKKIKEIEEGVVSEFIETLSDNDEIHSTLPAFIDIYNARTADYFTYS